MTDQSVFDEIRAMPTAAPQSASESVFDEVRNAPAPPPERSTEPAATWLGAVKGVGDAGLALGSGGLKALSHSVNDLLPDVADTRSGAEQDINQDPILNYQPQTEEGKYLMGKIRTLLTPITWAGNATHDWMERSFGKRTADVAGDVATVAPFVARNIQDLAEIRAAKKAAIETGHPLTDAALGEADRLAQMKSQAEESGFDLPEGGTAERHAMAAQNNRPLVNEAIRDELKLPENAPLTPNMLESARRANVRPAYSAIETLKDPIPLDQDALTEARSANMNGVPSERLPFPQGNSISGREAVDFSRKARFLANQLEKNPANPFASQDAQMYRDAAEAVENSVADHLKATGRGQLASNWDNARVYAAKTYSVEGALDGAGNVKAADLKTQLFKRGKPLSGQLEQVANLAAQYPEAFRSTRVSTPIAGPIRRAAAAALPVAGAAIGGQLGGGLGGAAGEAAGSYAGNKLLGR